MATEKHEALSANCAWRLASSPEALILELVADILGDMAQVLRSPRSLFPS